jgi:hypothetical protein
MATRFTIRSTPKFGVTGVPSGYEGLRGGGDLTIPSCGIEDVDRALFGLFDKEIGLQVNTAEGPKPVPVIVAAGEKWSVLKNGKALRDKNGSLILPLITIVKQDVVQTLDHDIAGRGSNQAMGEVTIKRRLSQKDRGYQALINKLFLRGQSGVAVQSGDGPLDEQVVTSRDIGSLSEDPTINDGGYLVGDRRDNIFEVITLPTPQYVTLRYELTLWTQYQQQMNEVIESIISSYMPQVRGWRLDTPKGYWFNAYVTSDEFKSQDNVDDMTKQERIVKRTFNVEVPAFILASTAPGVPVPIRRHISNPFVSFGVSVGSGDDGDSISDDSVVEPFLGADDPTLPLANGLSRRRDRRETNGDRLYPSSSELNSSDPALTTMKRGRRKSKWKKFTLMDSAGNRSERLVRVKSYNRHTGEMVLDGNDFDIAGLTILSVDD